MSLKEVDASDGNSTSKKNIIIMEPRLTGHHGPYLHWMATGLCEQGHAVTVVTLQELKRHPIVRQLSERVNSDASLKVIFGSHEPASLSNRNNSADGLATRELAYWRLFRKWHKKCCAFAQPDVVFLPYADYCLHAIGLLGSPFGKCRWAGVTMRPSFHYQKMGVFAPQPSLSSMKRWLFHRVLRNRQLKNLFLIDEPLFEYVNAARKDASKVKMLWEPAEFVALPNQDEAKRLLGLLPDRRFILIYGAISSRKGFAELLSAVASDACPKDVGVLVAGKLSGESRNILRMRDNSRLVDARRVVVLDRFIETEEETLLFAAADIVWLGYKGHYNSSGVLQQAAAARKPVIACKEGVIGWNTKRHNLGAVIDPADSRSVVGAIDYLLTMKAGNNNNAGPKRAWRPPTFSEAAENIARNL